jgi:hypothetical protein
VTAEETWRNNYESVLHKPGEGWKYSQSAVRRKFKTGKLTPPPSNTRETLLDNFNILYRERWSRGNLCSVGARFESRPGHWLSSLRFYWFLSVHPGKFCDSASIRPWSLPSKSLPIHHSINRRCIASKQKVYSGPEVQQPLCDRVYPRNSTRRASSVWRRNGIQVSLLISRLHVTGSKT